jgi:hypothetical protein
MKHTARIPWVVSVWMDLVQLARLQYIAECNDTIHLKSSEAVPKKEVFTIWTDG